MMDMAHVAGLIAADLHPDPVPYCDVVTSTTHKTLRGPRAGLILCKEEWAKAIDKAVFPGIQGGPLMHIIAAKAVAFHEAAQPDFVAYQQRVLDNAAGIHTNKNMIPFDPKPPLTASGIRLGTPAATTRGFSPEDMRQVGRWIGEIVHHVEDQAVIARVHRDVIEFASRFPVPA
jgi:glycine hydroxymethyltransferase